VIDDFSERQIIRMSTKLEKLEVSMEQAYLQQCKELEKKDIRIWDVEEENRVLIERIRTLEEEIDKKKEKIEELTSDFIRTRKRLEAERKYYNSFVIKTALKIKRFIFR